MLYVIQQRWKEIEELFTQKIKTQQKILKAEDSFTMLNMIWFATSYMYQNQWKKAEALCMQRMEINKKLLKWSIGTTWTARTSSHLFGGLRVVMMKLFHGKKRIGINTSTHGLLCKSTHYINFLFILLQECASISNLTCVEISVVDFCTK